MNRKNDNTLDRRGFLKVSMSACALACMDMGNINKMEGIALKKNDESLTHKFDAKIEMKTTHRKRVTSEYRNLIDFINCLRKRTKEKALIPILNEYSAELGRKVGKQHLKGSSDNSFQTFVKVFRPPNYKNSLTHEVIEDTETTFELCVSECIWASVFRDEGLGGDIGHAMICNMDYYWPLSFNPKIRMTRSKTLMQGDDQCNHRYTYSK